MITRNKGDTEKLIIPFVCQSNTFYDKVSKYFPKY